MNALDSSEGVLLMKSTKTFLHPITSFIFS